MDINVPGYKVGGILISEEQMNKRLDELAAEIMADYGDEPVLAVGVLKGSFMFMSDLVKRLDGDVTVDFLAASSYGSGTETSGSVKIKKDLDTNPSGKNILIIEDIVDSGVTLKYLKDTFFAGKGAKSVKIVTMLDKAERRIADVTPDYKGFDIENLFVIGYGLDYDQKYRNLPYITYLEEI